MICAACNCLSISSWIMPPGASWECPQQVMIFCRFSKLRWCSNFLHNSSSSLALEKKIAIGSGEADERDIDIFPYYCVYAIIYRELASVPWRWQGFAVFLPANHASPG